MIIDLALDLEAPVLGLGLETQSVLTSRPWPCLRDPTSWP